MNKNNEHKYDDIISLPHHVSKVHPRMSIQNRAAQFVPFAALTGYEEGLRESIRLTDKKIELDDETKDELNRKLQQIKLNIKNFPNITFTYFIKDSVKDGGAYITTYGVVKKIDEDNKLIILDTKEEIPIQDILKIEAKFL